MTFYAIKPDDWSITYGTLSNTHNILVENFISEDASTTSNSTWSSTGSIFIYPHNIKKTYCIEGVVEGQICFTSTTGTSYVSDYRISIMKISSSASETILRQTGVISVNDSITVNNIIVYPFWIDIFDNPKIITENERLAIKIEWNVNGTSSVTAKLSHWNDASYEDFFNIKIPFIM
jgi:hypothetical protein